MSLKQYQTKRDFKKTSEPKGKRNLWAGHLIFVVQKHATSHLHYDFRLELGGVLLSWAVPKGPSLDPGVKRLAVHVEDHPIEYASFEGTIPKGQYGAGKVECWDKGTWECLGDAKAQYKKGRMEFILNGDKLRGKWYLVQFKDQPKNWLLIKSHDKFSQSQVLSGAQKQKMPSKIHPELATLYQAPPTGKEWMHEIKLDGYRLISFIQEGHARCMTRNQLDWSDKIPGVIKALDKLKLKDCILDGELVGLDENNISNMQLLQNAFKTKKSKLYYYVFDLLYYDGMDLRQTPLIERKNLLKNLIPESDTALIRLSDHIVGSGSKIFKEACRMGLEGLVSKKIDSVYSQNRSKDWVKSKCKKSQEFVVCGYTNPQHSRQYFGSLLLGYYDEGKLCYCGHVGTGFTEKSLKEIYDLLRKITIKKSHFPSLTKTTLGDVHWVSPKMIIEVEYSNLTKDHILRHPSFKGMRFDKKPKEINLEKPHEK